MDPRFFFLSNSGKIPRKGHPLGPGRFFKGYGVVEEFLPVDGERVVVVVAVVVLLVIRVRTERFVKIDVIQAGLCDAVDTITEQQDRLETRSNLDIGSTPAHDFDSTVDDVVDGDGGSNCGDGGVDGSEIHKCAGPGGKFSFNCDDGGDDADEDDAGDDDDDDNNDLLTVATVNDVGNEVLCSATLSLSL
ncbi:hypothetical protein Ahia01_000304600 [Argonauta hians]